MRNHVRHLLTAYVHHQLPRTRRERVWRHVQTCPECRAALAREESLARDLKAKIPLIGRPPRGLLARLWPRIWAEMRRPSVRCGVRIPSFGVAAVAILWGALVVSALFNTPAQASAAPSQPVPAEIKATVTPIYTEEPTVIVLTPKASRTAYISLLPAASPAPIADPEIDSRAPELGQDR
jgi:anti-sigma factor RsiW